MALLLLAAAWLSPQADAQLSVTVHVPIQSHSSQTAAQLSVARRKDDGEVDDEDDNEVEDDAENGKDDDEADKEDDNMSAWLAHGILAFFAWGVLVPLAVNSSLF